MNEAAPPADAGPPPGPSPIALAVAYDLVTRYRLRLADSRDGRLSTLAYPYELAASAWTGPRAALVAFYEPPLDPALAGRDLAARCEAARRWGHERLQVQGAAACDILLVALRPVSGTLMASTPQGEPVRVGAAWVDVDSGEAGVLLPIAPGLPSVNELRARARYVREGNAVPTLAAVDLAERQTVAGGYVAPVRRQVLTQPVVTYSLIAAFVVVYLAQKGAPALTGDWWLPATGAAWWQYVTSAFIHDPTSIFHILFNSLAMLWIGRLVEQLYGRLVLVGTFLITAIAGGLIWVAAAAIGLTQATFMGFVVPSLGASGGISGLVGLLLLLGVIQGKNVPVGVARSVRNYALIVIALNVAFGFLGGGILGGGTSPVNNFAHLGGLAAGALLGVFVPPLQRIGGRDLGLGEKILFGAAIALCAVAIVVGAASAITTPGIGSQ